MISYIYDCMQSYIITRYIKFVYIYIYITFFSDPLIDLTFSIYSRITIVEFIKGFC